MEIPHGNILATIRVLDQTEKGDEEGAKDKRDIVIKRGSAQFIQRKEKGKDRVIHAGILEQRDLDKHASEKEMSHHADIDRAAKSMHAQGIEHALQETSIALALLHLELHGAAVLDLSQEADGRETVRAIEIDARTMDLAHARTDLEDARIQLPPRLAKERHLFSPSEIVLTTDGEQARVRKRHLIHDASHGPVLLQDILH